MPTSPAIPCFESALLYSGHGLLEATNISEGRGTATPFRVAGAPWMDGPGIAKLINDLQPNGVSARPVSFKPLEGKALGWLLIRLIKKLHLAHFVWAAYPTYVNHNGARHLNLLTGSKDAESLA